MIVVHWKCRKYVFYCDELYSSKSVYLMSWCSNQPACHHIYDCNKNLCKSNNCILTDWTYLKKRDFLWRILGQETRGFVKISCYLQFIIIVHCKWVEISRCVFRKSSKTTLTNRFNSVYWYEFHWGIICGQIRTHRIYNNNNNERKKG